MAASPRTLFALNLLYLLLFPCWINSFLFSVHHFAASPFLLCPTQPSVIHHKNLSPLFFLIKILSLNFLSLIAKVFMDRTFYVLLPICGLYFLSSTHFLLSHPISHLHFVIVSYFLLSFTTYFLHSSPYTSALPCMLASFLLLLWWFRHFFITGKLTNLLFQILHKMFFFLRIHYCEFFFA